MYKFKALALTAALGLIAGVPQTATAQTKIYPYQTSDNYCPAGLQPVSINGVICCGQPNQHISYQSAMAHPVAAPKKQHRATHKINRARSQCEVGTKGCTFD